jgi:hypothetical protein
MSNLLYGKVAGRSKSIKDDYLNHFSMSDVWLSHWDMFIYHLVPPKTADDQLNQNRLKEEV